MFNNLSKITQLIHGTLSTTHLLGNELSKQGNNCLSKEPGKVILTFPPGYTMVFCVSPKMLQVSLHFSLGAFIFSQSICSFVLYCLLSRNTNLLQHSFMAIRSSATGFKYPLGRGNTPLRTTKESISLYQHYKKLCSLQGQQQAAFHTGTL